MSAWTPKRIRKLRDDAGISAERLAGFLGVTHNTVARWEADRFSPTQKHQDMMEELEDSGYKERICAYTTETDTWRPIRHPLQKKQGRTWRIHER